MDRCPKCSSSSTVIRHNLVDDLWYSLCEKCWYKSKPTKNYDNAWHWKPEGNKPQEKEDGT